MPMFSRPIAFRFLAVSTVLFLGLIAGEMALRFRERRIATSDDLDPGLVMQDTTLGWRLTPGWQGTHRHHDYEANYSISPNAFRQPDHSDTENRHLWAVLGDSFTFGFGVEDNETFVERLNEQAASTPVDPASETMRFVNLGVPGYSTDQQVLLLERELPRFKVQGVLLCVYLGNDLLDNLRSVPIQVPLSKPRFEMAGQELVLKHPEPLPRRQPVDAQLELRKAVLGEHTLPESLLSRLANRSALLRTLGVDTDRVGDQDLGFRERFAPALDLFERLIARLQELCTSNGTDLALVLLPGRSYVERPASLSAAYQEHLRREITALQLRPHVQIIDLAAELRRLHAENPQSWFFPSDGHLNRAGHRLVATFIHRSLGKPHTQIPARYPIR